MSESEPGGGGADATLPADEPAVSARAAAPPTPTESSGRSAEVAADQGGLERGARVGRFEVRRLLGAGGMGAVYVARDHELHRDVAVKVLHSGTGSQDEGSQGQQRILREAQAMAMVNHPHLVTIYDVGTHGGSVYLAMEYVEGLTLDAWLAGSPTYEAVIDAFLQAGEALQAVHEAGLVHRDFKPGNVMVTAEGQVRVLDLGIARLRGATGHATPTATGPGSELAVDLARPLDVEALASTLAAGSSVGEADTLAATAGSGADGGPGEVTASVTGIVADTATVDAFRGELTQLGALVGTPRYMSPEQVRGLSAGPAADQFAFAVCLAEALTGAHPFNGRGALMLMVSIEHDDRRPWPETEPPSAGLRAVLDRALAPDPADRFASMSDLLAAIRQFAGLRHQLRRLVERWLANQESQEYLLPPGERLDDARRLLERDPGLSPDERRFLTTSLRKVRMGKLQRRALIGGIAGLALAVPPTLRLVDRRGRQLDAAMRDALSAQLRRVEERLAPLLDAAHGHIRLMYEQRAVWLPLLGRLVAPGEAADPGLGRQLESGVAALNDYFRPVLEEASLMSSLMVAREDGLEFLGFEDPDARHLDPPYGFYNRVVRPERYGKTAFEVFWAEPEPVRSRWLAEGASTARGQVWSGYDPRGRPWYLGATGAPGSVVWTEPYQFFTSKDVGVTASIAWREGRSGSLHVLAVDFMLNELSRVTSTLDPPTFAALVVTGSQEVVAVPADPRFATPSMIRQFYRDFDAAHRARGGDLAPRLPHVDELGIPSVAAAVADPARAEGPVFRFTHEGETLWAGREGIGPASLGLELWLVQRPGAVAGW